MPLWRRLLCLVIGSPIALAGVFMLTTASYRMLIPAAFLIGVGGLLAVSGIAPHKTRSY